MAPVNSNAWAESPEHDSPKHRLGLGGATVYLALKGRDKMQLVSLDECLCVELILCRHFRACICLGAACPRVLPWAVMLMRLQLGGDAVCYLL